MCEKTREQFITKFSLLLSQRFDSMSIETISDVTLLLTEFISDYEINRRCTDIILYQSHYPSWLDEYFVAKCVRGCKDNSMKDYAYHLKNFFDFLKLPANKITESDIQKYIGHCMRIDKNSKCYTDHKRVIINDFFKWSVSRGYLESNPCESIPVIHYARTNRVPYTDEERIKIRNEVKSLRDKAIVETLISTACRVEELCRLNISDIDFDEGTVTLLGKGDKTRTSYMNAEMKHALKKYIDSRKDDNPALFIGMRSDRKTKKRERVTTHGVQAVTRRMSKSLDVDNIQPHRFRRTTASLMSNSGCNLSDIQIFLGHSSPSVTVRYIYNDIDNLKMIHKKFVR